MHIWPGLFNEVLSKLWVSCVCAFVCLSFGNDLAGSWDKFFLEVRFPCLLLASLRLPEVSACKWGAQWHCQDYSSVPNSEKGTGTSISIMVPVLGHVISSSNTYLKARVCLLLLMLNWKYTIKVPNNSEHCPTCPNPISDCYVKLQNNAAIAEGVSPCYFSIKIISFLLASTAVSCCLDITACRLKFLAQNRLYLCVHHQFDYFCSSGEPKACNLWFVKQYCYRYLILQDLK